jgi:hypothetical protein
MKLGSGSLRLVPWFYGNTREYLSGWGNTRLGEMWTVNANQLVGEIFLCLKCLVDPVCKREEILIKATHDDTRMIGLLVM